MLPLQKPKAIPLFASDAEASFRDTISAQAEQTLTELPGYAALRYYQGLGSADDKISFDQARGMIDDAGLSGQLEVPSLHTPSKSAIDLLIERKRDELRRNDILARSSKDLGTQSAQFATALVTSFVDPVNVLFSIVPVAGQVKWAKAAQQSASALTRFGGRAVEGAIEGAFGAAIAEPIVYLSKMQEQADYDLADSLSNIAFGTVFGGGLHTLSGAIGDAYRGVRGVKQPWQRAEVPSLKPDSDSVAAIADEALKVRPVVEAGEAMKIADRLTLQEAESVMRVAVDQMMEGRPVDVDDLVKAYGERTSDGVAIRDMDPTNPRALDVDIQSLAAVERQRLIDLPTEAAGAAVERIKLTEEAAKAKAEGRPLTPEQKEAVRQSVVSKAVREGLPVPDRYVPREMKAEASANRGRYVNAALDRKRQAVTLEQAQKQKAAQELAREPTPTKPADTVDEQTANIETELEGLEASLADYTKRLGDDKPDAEIKAADDMVKKADRWSKMAETAQLCVLRGG